MKTVVICRHAKSDWSQELTDIDRPLNGRGAEDAPMMGKVLHKYGFSPDLIISSPAVRAITTAQAVAGALRYQGNLQTESGIYYQGEAFILEMLKGLPDTVETVMVFGHNHAITAFVNTFGNKSIDNVPTCGVVTIEFDIDNWNDLNKGKTVNTLFPRDLKNH